jgi:hypothetical protein
MSCTAKLLVAFNWNIEHGDDGPGACQRQTVNEPVATAKLTLTAAGPCSAQTLCPQRDLALQGHLDITSDS